MQAGHAVAHTLSTGDAHMDQPKKKVYSLRFVQVEDRSTDIALSLAKSEIELILAKYGLVSDNLDDVLHKYITANQG